ncbi:hypothetical protein BRADI_1g62740v3 [Brachypodium distachyon]|uniref:Uncharacterized protein n=2 Tax=Brachypodium distachyon TaxID=15368 RepID=I1H5L0_BRADI|nr:hypothetical protein BRADI_1g62740v3 [Brachypodium distachyon]
MVKVHSSSSPWPPPPPDSPSACPPPDWASAAEAGSAGEEGANNANAGSQREVFTIWMKSLLLNGSGCTVFDSCGRVVYRVDNYGGSSSRLHGRRSAEAVCLMDVTGSVVLQLLRKKFGRWEGHRSGWCPAPAAAPDQEPWFTVDSKAWGSWRHGPRCEFFRSDDGRPVRYKMADGGRRAASRIVDEATGLAVAEVKRKLTATGVSLGEDVLTLVVEPGVDRELIVGLLVVHGLINHSM